MKLHNLLCRHCYSDDCIFLCEFINCGIIFSVKKIDYNSFVPKKLEILFDCKIVDYYKIQDNLWKVVLL